MRHPNRKPKAVPVDSDAKVGAKDMRTPPQRSHLPSDIPGVYLKPENLTDGHRESVFDKNGVRIDFKTLRAMDKQRFEDVGVKVEEPADLLKAISLDPRFSLATRLEAAKQAAPYFTAKKVAIQGGGEGAPPIELQAIVGKLSQSKLDELEKALERAAKLITQGAENANSRRDH